MDDISAQISQILSDPAKMQQIQAMASSLGLGQGESTPEQPPAPEQQATGGLPDLSSLSGLLSGLSGGGVAPAPVATPVNPGSFDVSALAGMLRTNAPAAQQSSSDTGGFNIGTLLKLQQAMANVQQNRANIDLLLALKPRLNEGRSKKVDDAIRVMQLIQFLPMLKETGLFGEMDNIIGKLGGITGGLTSITGGNEGGGLGNLLGGLLGRR